MKKKEKEHGILKLYYNEKLNIQVMLMFITLQILNVST